MCVWLSHAMKTGVVFWLDDACLTTDHVLYQRTLCTIVTRQVYRPKKWYRMDVQPDREQKCNDLYARLTHTCSSAVVCALPKLVLWLCDRSLYALQQSCRQLYSPLGQHHPSGMSGGGSWHVTWGVTLTVTIVACSKRLLVWTSDTLTAFSGLARSDSQSLHVNLTWDTGVGLIKDTQPQAIINV